MRFVREVVPRRHVPSTIHATLAIRLMLGLLPFSLDRHCPRCRTRVEPDFAGVPLLARGVLRVLGGHLSWRWCRRCNWRGLVPRGEHARSPRTD